MESMMEENESFSCSSCIPESLVEYILSWVPPKSLARFRCVSRSWNTLIHDPFFVSKHLHNANKKMMIMNTSPSAPLCLIGSIIFSGAVVEKLSVDDDVNNPIHCSISDMKLPFTKEIQKQPYLRLGSHCNGLICFYEFVSGIVYLCNPAINESRIISPISSFHNISKLKTTSVGLGYDSGAKDYKIIRIASIPSPPASIEAELYTLSSNSWKEIKFDYDDDNDRKNILFLVGRFHCQVYCKGVYYWLVNVREVGSELKQGILSFDFHDEQFSLIQLPQENGIEELWISIQVWNERVAVFCDCCSSSSSSSSSVEMWVMMMDGCFGRGWTKHAVIEFLLPGCPEILRFWKSDELLVEISSGMASSRKLVSYNVLTRRLREFSFGSTEPPCLESLVSVKVGKLSSNGFVSYVESLVSVKGTQGNNISREVVC